MNKNSILVLLCLLAFSMILAGCDYFASAKGENNNDGDPPTPVSVTYTISFVANGGSGSMDSVTVDEGASYTVPACGFSGPMGTLRRFACWNTADDGSGTAYAASDVATITADTTLYAQWTKPLFSVAADKKIYFSKGNLYYNGSALGFEENQFDYRTWAGKNACIGGTETSTGTPSGNVGLFYWSKDKRVAYAGDYGAANTTCGITPDSGDTFFANTDSSVIGAEWGALTPVEWQYLFVSRTDATNKIGFATVGGVHGIILLPDTFTDPMKNNGIGAFVPHTTAGWSANIYTAGANWDAMEAAGAIFLPASGTRDGSTVSSVGNFGYYWSSSPNDNFNAYKLSFNGANETPAGSNSRTQASSIRLVLVE